MRMTVQVTADHISRGVRKICTRCPVALAIKDATGAKDVEVYAWSALFNGKYWTIDEASANAIGDFDLDGCMDPREVILEKE